MNRSEKIKFIILRSIGNFLVLFALLGVVATFGPAVYYEIQFRVISARGVEYKVEDNQKITSVSQPTLGQVINGPKQQVLIPSDTNFSILIPKIGANSRVFPNVDPASENAFLPILKEGVAHAKGTVFPGMAGNIYLFAHSTDNFWDVGRYNAVFYLLKNLSPGDEIVIFFENVRHNYVVTSSRIVDSKDVSAITNAKTGKEQLVLQTCWPPGTTWKRLLVFAKPK